MLKLTIQCAVALLCVAACGGSTQDGAATGGSSAGGSGGALGGTGGGNGGTGTGGTGNLPGLAGWKKCTEKGTCVLSPTNCCGYCDPNASIKGFEAINTKHASDYSNVVCADDVLCPDCVNAENPNNLALCRAGICTGVDLRRDELSACKTQGDCRLRWGSRCCESCGEGKPDELIAYNKNANLEQEVCSPFAGACPPCAPPPIPSHFVPTCVQGHCSWTLVGP